MTIPTLTTERLTLRGYTLADWPAYRAFYKSDATDYIGGRQDMRSAWSLFAGQAGHWALHDYGWFIVDDGTGAVGSVGLHNPPHHPDLEIGWIVFEAGRGKGYATEAAQAALTWGADVIAAAPRLVSYIDRDNAASKRVATKLGARFDGEMAAHDPACEVWVHPPEAAA
jgi:RimJ/RimL family protein N-acetyltransferase